MHTSLQPKDQFDLSDADYFELERRFDPMNLQNDKPEDPDNWMTISLKMPKAFYPIFKMTLEGYKELYETEKDFPALEAMVIEAKNSLIQF